MKKKAITYLSNGFLIAGAMVGLYAFVDTMILRGRLPAGTCPVTGNRPLFYTSIAFLGISFLLSLLEGKKTKGDGNRG